MFPTFCYGLVYYVTGKDIHPGEELFIYYGSTYARILGIDLNSYFGIEAEVTDDDNEEDENDDDNDGNDDDDDYDDDEEEEEEEEEKEKEDDQEMDELEPNVADLDHKAKLDRMARSIGRMYARFVISLTVEQKNQAIFLMDGVAQVRHIVLCLCKSK